ncbi:hypothetical protein ACS0TY_000961 [Phlomoides rotata]
MHTTTDVGFNTTTSQLDCTDDQWEAVVRTDHLMRGMRYKEWPYFPDWVDIFGFDRANGSVTEYVVEMAKRLKLMYGKPPPVVENQEHDGANYKSGGSEQHGSDRIDGTQCNDPTEGDSTVHGASNIGRDTTNGGARKKHKKSSESYGPSNMEQLLGEFCHTTGDRLTTIVGCIGYEHDLGSARKLLFEQLDMVPGLSIKDKLKAFVLIGGKVRMVLQFHFQHVINDSG